MANELINWSITLYGLGANVTYSTLALPDFKRDSLNRDIAEIRLRTGWIIDIEWYDEREFYEGRYGLTLYHESGEIEDYEIRIECREAGDIVQYVKKLAKTYSSEIYHKNRRKNSDV